MSRPAVWDATVVGCGPSGSACARDLARSGLRVLMIDRAAAPRYKTCGGGLVGRVRDLLEDELAGVVEDRCHRAELRLPEAGLEFAVERPEPIVTMTMRADFDQRLLESARAAGAEVAAPRLARGLDEKADRLLLHTDRGSVATRFLVAADGAAGPLARAAGWPELRRVAPALESEVEVTAGVLARFRGTARFDLGGVPHGYAWIFPKRERLSIGCLSTRGGASGLKRAFEEYLSSLDLGPARGREDHGFVIPLAPRARRLARGRTLLVGDAAGLADPLTCEGITWALVSGRLAARAIAGAAGAPAAARSTYHRLLAAEVLPELRLARLLARLLYDLPPLRRLVLRRAGGPLTEVLCEVFAGRARYRELLYRPRNHLRLVRRLLGAAPRS